MPVPPGLTIRRLLRPHVKGLTIGIAAVLIEGAASLAEPWPLKIVLDNVLKGKPGNGWFNGLILSAAGTDKLAILKFAALAVLLIAAVGAISSYIEKYITTNLGQWVMHDLRRTLYSHIQRLSLGFHDQKQTGDLVSRLTSDIDAIQGFISSGLVGGTDQQPYPRGHGGHHVLPELAVHADCAFRGAAAVRGRLQLHPPHQKGYARSAAKGRRDRVGHPGGLILHARGEGFWARRIRTAAHGGGEPGIHRDRVAGPWPEGQAFTDGRHDHRGGNLPRTVVWGADGFDRLPERGFAGSLHLVPGQNVQTDAGTVEDDRRVLESRGGLRANPRVAGHRPRSKGPAGRTTRAGIPRQNRVEQRQFRLRAETTPYSSRSA